MATKTTQTAKPKKAATDSSPKKVKEVKSLNKKKILFVASESTPFIATGGLAEVIGSLSKALAASGKFDVRVVIPLFSDIKKEYKDKFTYLGNIYVHLAWRNQYLSLIHIYETTRQELSSRMPCCA